MNTKQRATHVRALFKAGCSLRGVMADQRLTQLSIANECDLPIQYVSPAIVWPGKPAAARLGVDNLGAIYQTAARLLGVRPASIPEYRALNGDG